MSAIDRLRELELLPEGWDMMSLVQQYRKLAAVAVEQARVAAIDLDHNEELSKMLAAEKARADRLDFCLRSACRKWALCCDESVVYPPRIHVAGDGWVLVNQEYKADLARRSQENP